MSTQEITSKQDQYTLWQILGIWLAGGLPLWLLAWVAYPALSAGRPPVDAGPLRICSVSRSGNRLGFMAANNDFSHILHGH